MALAQLLAEHPELPRLYWTITPDGHAVLGSLHPTDVTVASILPAYQRVLGGTLSELGYHSRTSDTDMYSATLNAVWRDARFDLSTGCPAALVTDRPAVTA
nr:hypothetical protein [Streptomyces sp. SID5468]